MKKHDVITVFVAYIAFSIAYVTDKISRMEYFLALITVIMIYNLLLICRIHNVLKTFEKRYEKDHVQ